MSFFHFGTPFILVMYFRFICVFPFIFYVATGLGRTILPQPVGMRYISKIDFKKKGVKYQRVSTGCIQGL